MGDRYGGLGFGAGLILAQPSSSTPIYWSPPACRVGERFDVWGLNPWGPVKLPEFETWYVRAVRGPVTP